MTERYLSIKQILGQIGRDVGFTIDEAYAIEWIADALDGIGAAPQYEEAVAFLEVKNFKTPIPAGTTHIIQIARDNQWVPEESPCPADVVETPTEETTEESSCQGVTIDCNGSPITGYEMAYYRPFFDLIYEYQGWTNSILYRNRFSPVRLANHSFFNSLVCSEKNEYFKDLYRVVKDEYTIQDPYIKFNFCEGFVAVSYRRVKVDLDGLPMIPDHFSYRKAIVAYVRYMAIMRKIDMGDYAAGRILAKYESDWHWYCRQAGNQSLLQGGVDARQNSLDQGSYLLPQQHRYYGFFGRMNEPEIRTWNHNRALLFRGANW